MEEDVVLSARSIVKRYGGVHALKGVNFDVVRGKVTTLFGENGAGKSTLMKILSGVETPTSGELTVDGEIVEIPTTVAARDSRPLNLERPAAARRRFGERSSISRSQRGRFARWTVTRPCARR